MSPTPTGRLGSGPGTDLSCTDRTGTDSTASPDQAGPIIEIPRRLDVDAAEAWAWLTEPERTAQWIGPWTGDPQGGGDIEITLIAEEGAPTEASHVLACHPPRSLRLRVGQGEQAWVISVRVEADEAGSRVILCQRLTDPAMAEFTGPGWEFYLDRLAAAVAGGDPTAISFDPDYHPGMAQHYRALVADRDHSD